MMQITGWAIVHSLWQGALIAVALGVFLWAARYASSQLRYVVSLFALALSISVPIITAARQTAASAAGAARVREENSATNLSIVDGSVGSAASDSRVGVPSSKSAPIASDFQPPSTAQTPTPSVSPTSVFSGMVAKASVSLQPILHWLVLAWLIGLLGLSARLLGGLIRTRSLTTTDSLPAGDRLRAEIDRVAARLHIDRAVRVVE
jgi:bla regulator protein BlaR1